MKLLFTILIVLLFAITPVWAAIRSVPDEYLTIQEAINDCNDGDMVIVNPGTYVENIDFLGKNITVTGTNPEDWESVEATIIDGNNTSSVVTFANGETSEAILTGFTITGGSSYEGSGIYCYYASPTITCNVITENHGQLNFNESISATYGGGVYFYYSNAVLTRNIIKNNSAYYGGAIRSCYEEPLISNNIIQNNSAYYGGGIYIDFGGYIFNNTIIDNDSFYGDASSIWDSGNGSNLYFRFSIYYGYEMAISNNIICNGKTNYGIYYFEDISGITIFSYNNVWGNEQGNYYDSQNGETDWTGINGNISEDPLFLDDYHIGTDSPCYNAGKSSHIPYLWQMDIDGECALMGDCIEIGADEVTGNCRPVADAGDNQYFDDIVSNVILNGTGSYDFEGDIISWHWEQTNGVSVTLSNSDTAEPNFVPPVKDIYYFQLEVFDGTYYSQTDNVMIVVGNRAPIAEAGADQACKHGEQVTLDAHGSYDLDEDDVLSYNWKQILGPPVQLSDTNTVSPSFTPFVTGDYVFELVVNDGTESSAPDIVTVICSFGNMPDAYGYSWIDSDDPWGPAFSWIDITQGNRNKIVGFEGSLEEVIGTLNLGFDFPFYGKTYNKCYLQSSGLISFDSSPITYSNQQIPQVDGYDNMIAWMWTILYPLEGSEIHYKSFDDYFVIQFVDFTLNYNGGIVNAEVILYESGKIVIQFKDFTGGRYDDQYTIGIENSDGTIGIQVAYDDYAYLHNELAIEFSLGGPYEPVAHAGSDFQHKVIGLITLDGTGSKDRDPNDVLTYQWIQTAGSTVELSDSTSATPSFMPAAEGEYAFELVVSDGTYTSCPDEVVIFIGNRTPVADAGNNKSCDPNQVIYLDGSGSYDLDMSDELIYIWTQVSGTEVELSYANTATPSFSTTILGEYVFELVVSDGIDQSQPDTVSVFCTYGSIPDEYGYSWIDSDSITGPKFKWIDIQNTGTQVSGIQNMPEASFGPFSLGFNFVFYGNTYDQFYIQSPGAISFDSDPIAYDNNPLPQVDGYDNMIAWMWTVMYPLTNSKLYYQQFDGYAVIQFVDYTAYFNNDVIVNAEVIIYESGKIKIQYKDISEVTYLNQYTIGIENADGTIGTQVACNSFNYVHDELAIEFTHGPPYEPVADAGLDQYLKAIELVTLDGTGSFDRDPADILTYQWSQISGPNVVLSDSSAIQPSFMPEVNGEYWFELIVSDGLFTSYPDEVMIVVGNRVPVAQTGPNKTVQIPGNIVLDGTYSYDFDITDELIYKWTQIAGEQVVLEDANTAQARFYSSEKGLYTFQLVVNDGSTGSEPAIIEITTVEVAMTQRYMNIRKNLIDINNDNSPTYPHYPDVSGGYLAYSLGPACDFSWDMDVEFLETCEFEEYFSTFTTSVNTSDIDAHPKIDGDIVVWFGGPQSLNPWGHEPSNSGIYIRNIATGQQKHLRDYTMSESYSHPAVSGNMVVWLEHLNLDTTPTDSTEARRWWNTPYNICGADISDLDNVEYFTIAENAGTRDPYPCLTYSSDYDDVIAIYGNIVVYEGNGDIYGADISDIENIKLFTICSNPARQYDPTISGNFVVWTDTRNDAGDIYGADISDVNNIREYAIIKAGGSQEQPDFDEHVMVYVDGSSGYGNIKACCITRNFSTIDIPLSGSPNGRGPATDGRTIVWLESSGRSLDALALDFSYITIDGPVQNINSGKRYDFIQFAINDSNEGDTIVVEPGVYYEKIDMPGKNIVITSIDPEDPNVVENTILTSSIQDAVVTFADGQDASCVITGFTITGSGNGIYCENFTSPEISNCNIVNNKSGGIFLFEGCEPIISHCRIMNNGSCGITMTFMPGRTKNYNYPLLTNCVIAQNSLYGIYGDRPVLLNCTISDNSQGGLYETQADVSNSIIYFNGDGSLASQVSGGSNTISYSDIQGSASGVGNIDADPLFANSSDYHLMSQTGRWDPVHLIWVQDASSSPCIDAGNPTSDIRLEPVPNGSVINMGAYGGTDFASMSP